MMTGRSQQSDDHDERKSLFLFSPFSPLIRLRVGRSQEIVSHRVYLQRIDSRLKRFTRWYELCLPIQRLSKTR